MSHLFSVLHEMHVAAKGLVCSGRKAGVRLNKGWGKMAAGLKERVAAVSLMMPLFH